MQIDQRRWTRSEGWSSTASCQDLRAAELVLVFAASSTLERPDWLAELQSRYPEAALVVCSTAGEICGTRVDDDSVVATALELDHSRVRTVSLPATRFEHARVAGRELAERLSADDLRHVLVFSDGTDVNGSSLVEGMVQHLPDAVSVTGGMAGDGERFEQTQVFLGHSSRKALVVGVGFYGDRLRIGHGSLGGWDPFGPERLVTRSQDNLLYELDGKSALGLYKKYLGDYAADLPASALLFPLAIRPASGKESVVRTVLGIDEENPSMTFAGDVPEGHYARLMRANFERLIDGATGAATSALLDNHPPEFALLISCVGRKMVLRQRIEEEVESVREIFGDTSAIAGFYSYGELAPATQVGGCELHNQTMTITTFREI